MHWTERFTSQGRDRRTAGERLYAFVMKTALDSELFETCALPDRFDTRAAMVSVVTALVTARVARIASPEARDRTQRLNALVLDGFDAAYREKGVGDHSIARKVRNLAEAHTGLGRAVFDAVMFETGDAVQLQSILERNGLAQNGDPRLADRLFSASQALVSLPDEAVLNGEL